MATLASSRRIFPLLTRACRRIRRFPYDYTFLVDFLSPLFYANISDGHIFVFRLLVLQNKKKEKYAETINECVDQVRVTRGRVSSSRREGRFV